MTGTTGLIICPVCPRDPEHPVYAAVVGVVDTTACHNGHVLRLNPATNVWEATSWPCPVCRETMRPLVAGVAACVNNHVMLRNTAGAWELPHDEPVTVTIKREQRLESRLTVPSSSTHTPGGPSYATPA